MGGKCEQKMCSHGCSELHLGALGLREDFSKNFLEMSDTNSFTARKGSNGDTKPLTASNRFSDRAELKTIKTTRQAVEEEAATFAAELEMCMKRRDSSQSKC